MFQKNRIVYQWKQNQCENYTNRSCIKSMMHPHTPRKLQRRRQPAHWLKSLKKEADSQMHSLDEISGSATEIMMNTIGRWLGETIRYVMRHTTNSRTMLREIQLHQWLLMKLQWCPTPISDWEDSTSPESSAQPLQWQLWYEQIWGWRLTPDCWLQRCNLQDWHS